MFKSNFLDGHWIFFIIALLFSIFIGTIISLSLTYKIYKSYKNTKIKIVDVIKFALSKFWTTLGTTLLMILMLIGLFLLLIVPGIIFAVYWTFVISVIIIKNLSGKKALDYSKSVVKKRWWKVLGYSIVLELIPIAITIIAMLCISAYYPSNIGYCVYFIISLLANVFMYVSQTVLFLELDKTKVN